MSSKIKVDTIENVAGSGNVSLGSGHNLVVPGNITGQGTAAITSNATVGGTLGVTGNTTMGGTAAITGNTTVGGTLVNTGLITASAGVAVGGTGSANTIDDYEEGTFTPKYGNDGNTVRSGSYVKQEGRYTKIGNIVYVYIRLRSNGINTSNGQVTITPLPFTAADIESNHGGGNFGFTGNWGSNHPNAMLVRENDTYVLLYHRYSASGGTTAIDQGDLNNGSDHNNIHLSMWYETT